MYPDQRQSPQLPPYGVPPNYGGVYPFAPGSPSSTQGDQPEPPEKNTIIIDNEALRQGFTIIPNYILCDTSLSLGARVTYTMLLSYAWQKDSCFPGQDRIAEEIGITRKAVIGHLQELKEQGYITWRRRGLGKTNIYHILDHTKREKTEEEKREAAQTPEEVEETPASNEVEDSDSRSNNLLHQDVTVGLHQDVTVGLHPYMKNTKNEEYEDNNNGVVSLLVTLGLTPEKINKLISKHGLAYLTQKLALLDWRVSHAPRGKPLDDKTAWFLAAVADDYAPPAEFIEWQKRQEKRKEALKTLEELEVKEEERRREERGIEMARLKSAYAELAKRFGTTNLEEDLWRQVIEGIRATTSDLTVQLYFAPTMLLAIRDGEVFLATPNREVRRRLLAEFHKPLLAVFDRISPEDHVDKLIVLSPPFDMSAHANGLASPGSEDTTS